MQWYRIFCASVAIGLFVGLLDIDLLSGRWWAAFIGLSAAFQALMPDDKP
jgi:hypothetical protein